MIISFIGPSGSGKGTQGKMLSSSNFLSISGGKILRDMYEKRSEEGIELYKKYWSKGLWVPDDIICRIVLSKVNFKLDNLLFDAFPRTLMQSITLDTFLNNNGKKLSLVFEFRIKNSNIIHRIKERSSVDKRKDDHSIDSIEKRIDSYYKNIDEIRKYYGERLIPINANNNREVMFKSILSIIEGESKE